MVVFLAPNRASVLVLQGGGNRGLRAQRGQEGLKVNTHVHVNGRENIQATSRNSATCSIVAEPAV